MLDDNNCISEISERMQRSYQLLVITLMKADRGLIENIHHAGQSRSDLARQSNPLRFSAGERIGSATERKI